MSPASPLKVRPQVSAEVVPAAADAGPTTFASLFYGIPHTVSTPSRLSPAQPFCTAFEDLISLTTYAARTLVDNPQQLNGMRELLVDSLTLLTEVVSQFSLAHEPATMLAWNPGAWISCILRCLEPRVRACHQLVKSASDDNRKVTSFLVVESVLKSVVTLHQAETLRPCLSVDDRTAIAPMINSVSRKSTTPARLLIASIASEISSTAMGGVPCTSCEPGLVTGRSQPQTTRRSHYRPPDDIAKPSRSRGGLRYVWRSVEAHRHGFAHF